MDYDYDEAYEIAISALVSERIEELMDRELEEQPISMDSLDLSWKDFL